MSDAQCRDHDDAQRAFDTGSVWTASEADLLRYLRAVASSNIRNHAQHPAEINRATVILAIIAERRLAEERRRNDLAAEANRNLARRNNAIALGSLVVAVASIGLALLRR